VGQKGNEEGIMASGEEDMPVRTVSKLFRRAAKAVDNTPAAAQSQEEDATFELPNHFRRSQRISARRKRGADATAVDPCSRDGKRPCRPAGHKTMGAGYFDLLPTEVRKSVSPFL
jgi:hypothetical protein